MIDNQHVRDEISAAYARALVQPAAESCCSGPQKGVAARLAGYRDDELEGLPDEAVENSFGCGNPLAYSEVGEGDVVLDLGCGAGIDLILAAKKVGRSGKVIGIDMTDAMLTKARETIAEFGCANAEVRKGLIEDMPVDDASIDWVISNCVVNLSPDKESVFAQIARVLKPGGRMLVSDIVAEYIPATMNRRLAGYGSCIAGAVSEEDYIIGLRRAGLVDVTILERIRYDTGQLTGLIESAVGAVGKPNGHGANSCSPDSVAEMAAACSGKIWSAKIFARKPA